MVLAKVACEPENAPREPRHGRSPPNRETVTPVTVSVCLIRSDTQRLNKTVLQKNMLRSILLPLLVTITLLAASCVMPSMPRPTQNFNIDPLDYGYVIGHSDANSQVLLNEFVRKGDSVKDWETLITRLYGVSGVSASEIASKTRADLQRDCPHAKVSINRISNSEYVVEYSHNGCGPFEGHRSVRKFIEGMNGVYMFAFDMKNRCYNASEFNLWRSRVISSKLTD